MRTLHLVPYGQQYIVSTPFLRSDEQALSDAPAVLLAALINLTMCSLPHRTLNMPTLKLNSQLCCFCELS